MRLTHQQIKTLSKLSNEHGGLDIEEVGPFLQVTVYVQSASSSGYTHWYYNKEGDKVDG